VQLYRRAILGMAWLVIRPTVTVVTSIFVVGRILGISTEPVPLLLFTLIGVALWSLFGGGIRHGTKALTRWRGITRRINLPRIMLVLGALTPASIEFAVVFVGAFIAFGYFATTGAFPLVPSLRILAIIPVLFLVVMLILAVTCVTSVLNTIASDTALSVNYATTGLLIVTPVVYPVAAVPESWQWVVLLNPLAPALEIWRWALLGTPPPPWWSVVTALSVTIAFLIAGLSFFLRWEQTVLDKS
jgi:lipopolysaccharide transport system permease protein